MTFLRRLGPAIRYLFRGDIPLPHDLRPCHTDEFIGLLIAADIDFYSALIMLKEWSDGDWVSALQGLLTPPLGAGLSVQERIIVREYIHKARATAFFSTLTELNQ